MENLSGFSNCKSVKQKIYDIRMASQREFEDFVFDHDPKIFAINDTWYHRLDTTVKYNASQSAQCFIEMFRTSDDLFLKYDRERLEQGFWAMTGSGFDGNLADLIWRSNIAPELKEELIGAMFLSSAMSLQKTRWERPARCGGTLLPIASIL